MNIDRNKAWQVASYLYIAVCFSLLLFYGNHAHVSAYMLFALAAFFIAQGIRTTLRNRRHLQNKDAASGSASSIKKNHG
jgi:uncharacterized membrane protein HdeD (DUF308 family)